MAKTNIAASLGWIGAIAVVVLCPGADATGVGQPDRIAALSGQNFGWLADTEFLAPASGPGPVTFDKAHPYIRNNTVGQPTFRIGDLTNPILQPWVVERMRRDNAEVLAGKVAFTARASCWPAGVPGYLVFGCGARTVYFLQTPKEVVMINEGDQQVRHIYLNVPHSLRPKPSWYGESVGHYEGGDTLVIDTIGLNDRTFVDNYRTPHSAELHVIERWTMAADEKTLNVDIRIEDPGAFTIAWSARQSYVRTPQGPLTEMVCAENNANYYGYDVMPTPLALKSDF